MLLMYIINSRRSYAYVHDRIIHNFLKEYASSLNRTITSLIIEGIDKYGDKFFYVPIVEKKCYNSIKLFPNQYETIITKYCYPQRAEFSSLVRFVIFAILMNSPYRDYVKQFYSRYPCLFVHKI
jgi:hypothetical protein